MYIIFEKNKEQKNHLHGIICVKNITDYNINLKNNISNYLRNNYEEDVVIKNMNDFLSIKNWISNYLWKDVDNWELNSKLWFLENYQQSFARFLDISIYELNSYNNFKLEANGFLYDEKELNEFDGCKILKNSIEKETVIDLILYYIQFNQLYIYKNNVYKKIKDSFISYHKVGSVRDELYINLQQKIIPFFIKKFPLHFKNFDFYMLVKKFLKCNEKIVEEIYDLTTNRIEPDFSLLEFKDGVYSIKYNKFIPKKMIEPEYLKLSTIKYYDKTYKHLGEPKKWIEGVTRALNIDPSSYKNDEKFTEICSYIANIFHKNKIFFSKKRVLYIHGESNTRKSTLISKPLISYFGIENVGFISDSKNFKNQHLIGKKVGVWDEFKYERNRAQEILKLFAGEVTISEQKFSPEHKIIENLPIIVISNKLIEEKDKKIRDAIFSRIFDVEFKHYIENNNKNSSGNEDEKIDTIKINKQIDDLLKDEEPKIIKFCNQIFYESKYKVRTRVDTQKLLKQLNEDEKKSKESNTIKIKFKEKEERNTEIVV